MAATGGAPASDPLDFPPASGSGCPAEDTRHCHLLNVDELHDQYERQLNDQLVEAELRAVMAILEDEYEERKLEHDGHLEFTALTGYFVDEDGHDVFLHKGLRSLMQDLMWRDEDHRLGVLPVRVLHAWWDQLRRHQLMEIPTRVCYNSRDGHCRCDTAPLPRPVPPLDDQEDGFMEDPYDDRQ